MRLVVSESARLGGGDGILRGRDAFRLVRLIGVCKLHCLISWLSWRDYAMLCAKIVATIREIFPFTPLQWKLFNYSSILKYSTRAIHARTAHYPPQRAPPLPSPHLEISAGRRFCCVRMRR